MSRCRSVVSSLTLLNQRLLAPDASGIVFHQKVPFMAAKSINGTKKNQPKGWAGTTYFTISIDTKVAIKWFYDGPKHVGPTWLDAPWPAYACEEPL